MRKVKSNPAWSDAIAKQFCDPILVAAKKYGLPVPLLDDKCVIASELGCGSYGCVFFTEDENCLFKLTTDSTEAHFAATAIKLRKDKGVDPAGLVDIRAVFSLPIEHRGDPVFVLWRERAVSVGLRNGDDCYSDAVMVDFETKLVAFYDIAEEVFGIAYQEQHNLKDEDAYWLWMHASVELSNVILDGKDSGFRSDFSDKLAECWECASDLERNEAAKDVGQTLKVYLENGILLADIHPDNVGVVERGKCSRSFVITDPGHSCVLKRDLSKISIKALKE